MQIVLAQSVHPHVYSPVGHVDIVRPTWNNLSRIGDILHCPWQSLEIYVNLSPCIGDNIRNRHTLAKFDQIPYSVGRTVKWASHGRNIGDFPLGLWYILGGVFKKDSRLRHKIQTKSGPIPRKYRTKSGNSFGEKKNLDFWKESGQVWPQTFRSEPRPGTPCIVWESWLRTPLEVMSRSHVMSGSHVFPLRECGAAPPT